MTILYAIKRKNADLYFNGSKSKAAFASMNDQGLVSRQFARIFNTERGARIALRQWSNDLIQTGFMEYEWRLNKERFDSMEIIPIVI